MYYERNGYLTTIVGSMFSEKSGELISRLLKISEYQHRKVCVFKPGIDNRFAENEVVSRIGLRIKCHNLPQHIDVSSIAHLIDQYDVFGIDEVQSFDETIMELVDYLLDNNKEVLVSGLNTDFTGKPFAQTANLMAMADEVVQKYAYCSKCGRPAVRSQLIVNGSAVTKMDGSAIVIGDKAYEPRCRHCFEKEKKSYGKSN